MRAYTNIYVKDLDNFAASWGDVVPSERVARERLQQPVLRDQKSTRKTYVCYSSGNGLFDAQAC